MVLRAICLLFSAASGALLAADPVQWPQYRGPQGAGIATTSAPLQFGVKENVLWAVDIPHGHSSPTVWRDHIFLSSFDKTLSKFELLDFDRTTGKIRWRQTIPAAEIEKVHAVSSPATATPIADGERVYTYFGSAGLFCHDFNGKLLWSLPMPVVKANFGSGTSPLLAGETLILARDDEGDRKLNAIDRKSGKLIWSVPLAGAVRPNFSGHATPMLWKDQIVLHRAGEIAAYAVSDGARKWWVQITSQGTGTPAIAADTLYVGAWGADEDLRDPIPDWQTLVQKYDANDDSAISEAEFPADLAVLRRIGGEQTPGAVVTLKQFFGMIDPDKDGKLKQSEWEMVLKFIEMKPPAPHGLLAIKLGGENDVTKTNVAWTESRAVPEVPMPLVYRERVYTVTNGGTVTVLDAASGKLMYRGRLGAGGLYYASPIAAGDSVYFASGDGVVTAIRAGDKLEVVAQNQLNDPVFATPSIVDGRIYVRTSHKLYAFGSTK
jgi:outer membrane protein assembly factor BamB